MLSQRDKEGYFLLDHSQTQGAPDELVIAANHSELDTSQARTGFETSLFKKLAAKNEERTTAIAYQFQDPLRQIVALAGICQWKADKLTADIKLRSAKNERATKEN